MPRDLVALVSADDFSSAIRIYGDRVHDLLRRSGVPPLEAIEVAELHAFSLLDAVVNAPETVIDIAGWWFARTLEFTGGLDSTLVLDTADESVSLLAGTSGEAQVRAAIAGLPETERVAVLLRDAYDLPPQAVAVALRRGEVVAGELIAAGRLHLVAAYDDRTVPTLGGHTGRTTVDLALLSLLAEGSLASPRAAPLRRHVTSCGACDDVYETLSKGRRLAAGLPIVAMPDDAREALLDRVTRRAEDVLPSHDEVLRAVDEDHDPGPVVPLLVILLALLIALALGVGIALVTQHDAPDNTTVSAPIATTQPVVTPSFTVPASGSVVTPGGTAGSLLPSSASRTTTRTPRTTSPAQGASSSPATQPATPTRIRISPTSGPSGTLISVLGVGFRPDHSVSVTYSGSGSHVSVTTDGNGRFTAALMANATLPGAYDVSATDGTNTASDPFRQRL